MSHLNNENMLVVQVSFPLKSFTSGNGQGESAKIPSPAQIISAFLSTGLGSDENIMRTLQTLETITPIVVCAKDSGELKNPTVSIVKHNTGSAPLSTGVAGHLFYEGNLSRGIKGFDTPVNARIHDGKIAYCYRLADASTVQAHVDTLQALCGQIGFLGKSSSPVIVECFASTVNSVAKAIDGSIVYYPQTGSSSLVASSPAFFTTTVPHIGYTQFMESRYGTRDTFYSGMTYDCVYASFVELPYSTGETLSVYGNFPSQTVDVLHKEFGAKVYPKFIPERIRTKQRFFSTLVVDTCSQDVDIIAGIVDKLETLSSTELDVSNYKAQEYFVPATNFVSVIPVSTSKNSIVAQAEVMASISEQTGLGFEDFSVELSPDFSHNFDGTNPIVHVRFNEPYAHGLTVKGVAFMPIV